MGKRPRWTAEEDTVMRKFYMAAPRGHRYLAVYKKLPGRTKDAVASRARYSGLVDDEAVRSVKRFLRSAAKEGWRLVPLEATDEMLSAVMPSVQDRECYEIDYRTMLAASPEFKWNK